MSDLKLKPEVKEQWLTALRSGEYTQAQEYLRTADDGYCCLGVLCDLAVKGGVIGEPHQDGPEAVWEYGNFPDDSGTQLPQAVADWAFGKEGDPYLFTARSVNPGIGGSAREGTDPNPDTGRYYVSLAELNDEGSSFAEIANLIEKYL
jgi:hypothetical protein